VENEKAQTMQSTETITTESLETKVAETIAEMKGLPTEPELQKMLRSDIFNITFEKLDGSLRTMRCTKDIQHVPDASKPKRWTERNDGTVTVWELDLKAWRSFKYNRLKKVDKAE